MKKLLLLLTFCMTMPLVYSQNTCATAVSVVAGITVVGDIVNGSQAPTPVCINGGTVATGGKWYSYTPVGNHTVTITTDLPVNIGDDPRVHIYTGGCTNLTCLAGDDDSGTLGNPDALSVVNFNAMSGQTYLIAFDNKWSSTGITFKLIENPYVEPPVTIVSFTPQSISLSGVNKECVVDMNGDYLDDIVGVSNGSVQILTQKGDGTGFTSSIRTATVTSFMPDWSIAAGDINNDGLNDLVYGNSQGVSFMKQNSNGTSFSMLSTSEYVFSQRSNFVDINNDGHLDGFVCHDTDPNVYYINTGNGQTMNFMQGGMGDVGVGGNYGSIFVDYDNDGDPDLFIAKCGSSPPDELHRNNGNGTFTNVSAIANMNDPSQSWSSAWADFDNDGDMDAMIGASSNTNGGHKLRRNNGDGTFTDITVGSGLDIFTTTNVENVAHDFDNDGFVDLFMGGSTILINNGNMTFKPNPINTMVGPIGDLNNDGFLDIQNQNTIYYNTGNNNNWITVNLQGNLSNRNGIGARVEIYGVWGKQIRDVRSGDGFAYMSTLNVHFGIGQATEITKLVVKWPSGIVDEILNPVKNQKLLVVEQSSLGTISNEAVTFKIYPNPATETIQFTTNLEQGTITEAAVYDLNGKLMLTSKVENRAINVHSLTTGMYIVTLKNNEGKTFSGKFLKK